MNFYRVNYNFVSPAGALRSATLVVQAENEGAAQAAAQLKIPASHRELAKITGSSLYLAGPSEAPAKASTRR